MKVEVKHWDYTCGDGCCYNYGVHLIVNGYKFEQDFAEKSEALEYFITWVLGYTVEEIHDYEDEDEA